MTEEEKQLMQSVLSEIAALRKEVAPISMALNYKITASKKKDSVQDIADALLAQSVLRGKGNRKHN